MTDKNKRDRMVVMLKLFRYLKPYWWQIIILLCAVAGQVWSALQLPALMASIVNDGIVAGDVDFIWGAGIKMVLYALVAAMGASLANFLSARIGTAFSRDLRRDIFAKVLSFSVADMNKFSTASLITRTTNDVSQVQQAAVMCMSMLLRAPMTAVLAVVQAIRTAPDMTWIIALAVGVIVLLVVVILAIVMPKFKIIQQMIDKITQLTRENLTGLRVIRAFNNEYWSRRNLIGRILVLRNWRFG